MGDNRLLTEVLGNDHGVRVTTIGTLGIEGNFKQKITNTAVNYTYQPGDGVLLVDTTAAEVVITLPSITAWPDEAYRLVIPLVHVAGENNVKVVLSGAETFAWGNTYLNLGTALKAIDFAVVRNGAMQKYGLLRNVTVSASAHRDAAWSATNFSTPTIIPWDTEQSNSQDELLVYTGGAASRYTALAAGDYKLSYMIDIDSTGGSTWNATAHIYKNSLELENSEVRTCNYGSEDQSMAFVPTYVHLAAGEYVDLRISQNSLTGSLVHAVFNIEIRL